jgi:hypothetical protein
VLLRHCRTVFMKHCKEKHNHIYLFVSQHACMMNDHWIRSDQTIPMSRTHSIADVPKAGESSLLESGLFGPKSTSELRG